MDHLADTVREIPTRICLGLASCLKEPFEIWHDYISVPQWQPRFKSRIIQAIPEIFNHAKFTVAHLADTDPCNVQALREGTQVYDRCRAISNICNARWFRRAWTAMEFIQSHNLRAMYQDYSLVANRNGCSSFVQEMEFAWSVEVAQQEFPQTIEAMVGMGYNLVPWQLGPLEQPRVKRLHGVQIPFAVAHEVLARRCITINRDFFHGLLGILKIGLTESQLSPETEAAMLEVARRCIENGDFSPLLMIPSSAHVGLRSIPGQALGYLDLTTFALGGEEAQPTHTEVKFRSGNPVIKAESIGLVQRVMPLNLAQHTMELFSDILKIVLDTSPDIDTFINTLGTRIYGQFPVQIAARLAEEDRRSQLVARLENLSSSSSQGPTDDDVRWIAEAMGLSNKALQNPMSELTPLSFLSSHGGTIHLGDCARLAEIQCPTCQGRFLLRLALLAPEDQVLGCKALRIPGLKYLFTQAGGAGFVLRDRRMVARFLWAAPTCACPKLEETEVLLADLPIPQPNTYDYGQQESADWQPVAD